MKRIYIIMFTLVAAGCSTVKETEWEVLFNGDNLDGWDTYLGAPFLPGSTWGETIKNEPIGLNKDTAAVFSVVEVDESKALRISGEHFGGISTKKEFENYHLQLEFKWGEKKWYPREKDSDKRDSGLLYHGTGDHGVGDGFWLQSQELQIQEGDCGDYWGIAGGSFDIKVSLNKDSIYQYDPNGTLQTFNRNTAFGRNCKKYPDAERPTGIWNTIDLYCYKDSSIHVVNGVVTMVLANSKIVTDSTEVPLTKGKIQLQTEAAEVYYRNIRIRPIDRLPAF